MMQISLVFLIIAALTLGCDPLQRIFPSPWNRRLLRVAFILYILGNLYFTILSRTPGSGTYFDPRPFGTYLRKFESIKTDFANVTGFASRFLKDISSFVGVILNILLYYPLGYLVIVLFPNLKPWQIILIGCAASAATELTQYTLKMGWFETDDILCNTLGTVIGLYVRLWQNRLLLKRK